MKSFQNFCRDVLVEFKENPQMLAMAEGSIATVKHKKYEYRPGGKQMKEIFLLMTPAQFYEDEEKEGRLKAEHRENLNESYWSDLSAMKFTPERDYKSWMDNVRSRIQIVNNLVRYNDEQLTNKLEDYNELSKEAFEKYAKGYESQTEKRFQAKRAGTVQKNFKNDLFAIFKDQKFHQDEIETVYNTGLTAELAKQPKFPAVLKKALNTEMNLLKGTYKEPAVNKPLLHSSAMKDGLFVENEKVLIDYLTNQSVPFDGILRNIYRKDGKQLSKKEVQDLFAGIQKEINELVKQNVDKDKATKQVIAQYFQKSKNDKGSSNQNLKFFFYDGVTKEASKFKEMNEQELIRRFKSYNKRASSLERNFKKSFDPSASLSQNQKMMKSMGALGKNKEIYDFTLPAYKGLVYMERPWVDVYGNTQKPGLAILNTCPSAALCKSFCYATKGFYTMYSSPSISAAQVLTYLVNHPEQFEKQVSDYLQKLAAKSKKEIVIRWHDAGDFFSRSYYNMVMRIASKTPELLHYAYTKRVEMIHEIVTGTNFKGGKVQGLSQIPSNFVFNLSFGGTYDKKIEKVPELAEFKFSKVIDLNIPVHEHFEHVTKRDVLSDEEIRKAVQIGEENHHCISLQNQTETLKSMTYEGKVHNNVKVTKKVLSFKYIPKLAVIPANTMETFREKNSELIHNFRGIENHVIFHKMFEAAKGHKHGRVVFDEKALKGMISAKELKELEEHYTNLYKTYLPAPALEVYKKALQKYYGFDKPIKTYEEMIETPESKSSRNNFHVLVSTNDGDVSAQRRDVHGTLLVIH